MKPDAFGSLGATLDILRRLLDEESLVLAQLTSVVEHIYTPLLEGCNPSHIASQHKQHQSQDAGAASSTLIVTFAQHWELFANMATLHESQRILVGKLEESTRECTALLDQQQRYQEKQEERCAHTTSSLYEATKLTEESNTEARDVIEVSLRSILEELFCSSAMRHYMAEHMMYSLNYSRNIVPRVLDLARLWRCCGGVGPLEFSLPPHIGAGATGTHASSPLRPEERQRLRQYTPLLHFLCAKLGGESGVPLDDPRVVFARLPETPPQPAGGYRTAPTYRTARGSAFGASTSGPAPPQIPDEWRGFETLIMLLATPLASLRRYTHVARCLIESQCLSKAIRRMLQTEFVDIAAQRLAEEGSIVLDELARQDVAHIVELFEEVPMNPGTGKKTASIQPDSTGSRVLVHYGRLSKRFRRGRHERLMFLFNDWLCYVEELTNGRMRLRASIPLETIKIVDLDDDTLSADAANTFEIVTHETRLTFFAPTAEQKRQWVDALRNTARAHQKRVRRQGGSRAQLTGDVLPFMRPSAAPVAATSRLRRQQRADAHTQRRVEMESNLCTHSLVSAPLASAANTPNPKWLETPRVASTASVDLCRSMSSVHSNQRRWLPQHGSFDVTHWAQQSTGITHARIRSADFLHTTPSPLLHPAGWEGSGFTPEADGVSAPPSPTLRREVSTRPPVARLLSERFQEAAAATPHRGEVMERKADKRGECGDEVHIVVQSELLECDDEEDEEMEEDFEQEEVEGEEEEEERSLTADETFSTLDNGDKGDDDGVNDKPTNAPSRAKAPQQVEDEKEEEEKGPPRVLGRTHSARPRQARGGKGSSSDSPHSHEEDATRHVDPMSSETFRRVASDSVKGTIK